MNQNFYNKPDLIKILTIHNVHGLSPDPTKIDLAILYEFNKSMKAHLEKYPDHDIFGIDDYVGKADDDFISNILLPISIKIGFSLITNKPVIVGGTGGELDYVARTYNTKMEAMEDLARAEYILEILNSDTEIAYSIEVDGVKLWLCKTESVIQSVKDHIAEIEKFQRGEENLWA